MASVKSAFQYLYLSKTEQELSKFWHNSESVKDLELHAANKEEFKRVFSAKLGNGVELGKRTKDGIVHHPGQELILSAPKSLGVFNKLCQIKSK